MGATEDTEMAETIDIKRLDNGKIMITSETLHAVCEQGERMDGTIGWTWTGDYMAHTPALMEMIDAVAADGRERTLVVGDQGETPSTRAYPADATKAAEWDRINNEGAEGYNPYR